MHGITHPELIKRLYERIPRSMDEMYRVTTSFLQGEVAAFSHGRKKAPTSWKQPEGGNKPRFKKGFKNKHRSDRKPDRFSLLTKTPKEIFALEKGKFKALPPMVTPTEKRDPNKYCDFHADTGHSTDECMQLRKQIDEMIKAGKLSQFIKELKQNDKPKAPKKGDTTGKMIPPTTYLTGFSGETIWPLGQISLLVKIGDEGHSTSAWMNFMVVGSPSQHNKIIGRPGIRKIYAIPSTVHGMLKFPVEGGTVNITKQSESSMSTLTKKGRKELCTLLGQNLDAPTPVPPPCLEPAEYDGASTKHCGTSLEYPEGWPPVMPKKRGKHQKANNASRRSEQQVDAGTHERNAFP
ncbi:hypothetical protein Tco_1402976 [Tanacetum coccineum]